MSEEEEKGSYMPQPDADIGEVVGTYDNPFDRLIVDDYRTITYHVSGITHIEYRLRHPKSDEAADDWVSRNSFRYPVDYSDQLKRVKGYRTLTDRQKQLLHNTFLMQQRARGLDYRGRYNPRHLKQVKWDAKERCLEIHYQNGEWWHYGTDGTWW